MATAIQDPKWARIADAIFKRKVTRTKKKKRRYSQEDQINKIAAQIGTGSRGY